MVLEQLMNLDRNLFAAEYSVLTWRFASSSSPSKYWFRHGEMLAIGCSPSFSKILDMVLSHNPHVCFFFVY